MDSLLELSQQLESRAKIVREQLAAEQKKIEDAKKQLDDEKEKMSTRFPIEDELIELNVGGVHYATLKQTLMKQEGSLLHAMFSGRYPLKKDSTGRYFIDRDGEIFGDVLYFLRTDVKLPQESARMKIKFKTELEYFGLTAASAASICEGSSILDEGDQKQLLAWLEEDTTPGARIETKLLFRASENNFRTAAFHTACDNKGPTVVLVKSGNYIFGGYSPEPWNQSVGNYTNTNGKSWIFSLKNPSKRLAKIRNAAGSGQVHMGVYSHASYGPTFGGGHDFRIADQCNANTNSYTNLSYSYNATGLGLTYQGDAKTFFTGSYEFQVTEYEVYSVTF